LVFSRIATTIASEVPLLRVSAVLLAFMKHLIFSLMNVNLGTESLFLAHAGPKNSHSSDCAYPVFTQANTSTKNLPSCISLPPSFNSPQPISVTNESFKF
jgi:hypothetical protein